MPVEKVAGVIKDYAWGTPGGIDRVRGRASSGDIQAEWWLGDHPQGMATVIRSGEEISSLLASFGDGRLGFLLKVLTPAAPLSLQVHPTTEQAVAGFEAEERLGINLDDPARIFRDRSAKPELIVCVTGVFEALAGNARDQDVSDRLDALQQAGYPDEFAAAWRAKLEGGRADTVAWLLGGSDEAQAVVSALGAVTDADPLLGLLWNHYPGDPGCAVAMMLNRVSLKPGEALFVDAGQPHAYLSGVGIELMAPSDNVLRGGLTPKHIDIDQLLEVASFDPSEPPLLDSLRHSDHWVEYRPVDHDFSLHRIDTTAVGSPRVDVVLPGPAICLSIDDGATVSVEGQVVELATGEAVVVVGDQPNTLLEVLPGSALWMAHRR